MNGGGKSDNLIVPKKVANKEDGRSFSAERLEGRGLAKRNSGGQNRTWTQRQTTLKQALDRIREAAKEDRQQRFTAGSRMVRIADRWIPLPRTVHPYPSERLRVTTRGRSPVR